MRPSIRRAIAPFLPLLLLVPLPAAGGEWEQLPPRLTNVEDCPREPGCAAAVLLDETLLDNEYYAARVYRRRIIRVFKPEGLDAASITIPEIVGRSTVHELKGRTILPDGSSIELDPYSAVRQIDVQAKGFKRRSIKIQMPGVVVGAYLEYSYRTSWKGQFRSYEWHFQDRLPVLEAKLTALAGRLRWSPKFANLHGARKTIGVDEEGRSFVTVVGIPALKTEPFMPPEDEVTGRMLLYPSEGTWAVLGLSAHEYYSKFYKRSKKTAKLTRELMGELADPEEKLARIYHWLQENIENTSFSRSAEGTVEDDDKNIYVDDVLAAKQANQEELAQVFTFMAREAGLEAELALVSTRDTTFFRPEVLDFWQFNGRIAAVKLGDQWSFYDPGTPYLPPGMVAWPYEGLQENALVTRPRGGFLVRVPISSAGTNLSERVVRAEVSANGDVRAHVEESHHGLAAVEARNILDHRTDEDRRNWMRDQLRGTHRDLEVETFEVANLDAWDEPLLCRYEVILRGYAVPAGSRLIFPAALFHAGAENPFSAPERQNPVYFPRTSRLTDRITFELPEGYEVEELPSRRRKDVEALAYSIDLAEEEGTVVVERERVIDIVLIGIGQYDVLREMFEEMARRDESQIVLRAAAAAAPPEPAGAGDAGGEGR